MVSTFTAVEQSGVSLGTEAAACSRGPASGIALPRTARLCYRISQAEGHSASSNLP